MKNDKNLLYQFALKVPGGVHHFQASSMENLISDVEHWFREAPGSSTDMYIASINTLIRQQLKGKPGLARGEMRYVGDGGNA